MCASSMALMFSIVAYLVSKVDVSGPQSPAEMHVPEQIEHGLIVHHLARRDQYGQDDGAFASIHDVVCVLAQLDSSTLEAHRCRIRIGGTYPKVSSSPIEAMDFSLLPTSLCNPVVASSSVCH